MLPISHLNPTSPFNLPRDNPSNISRLSSSSCGLLKLVDLQAQYRELPDGVLPRFRDQGNHYNDVIKTLGGIAPPFVVMEMDWWDNSIRQASATWLKREPFRLVLMLAYCCHSTQVFSQNMHACAVFHFLLSGPQWPFSSGGKGASNEERIGLSPGSFQSMHCSPKRVGD